MGPAALSINAGFQCSSVEMAVKPARVIPAANGCYNSRQYATGKAIEWNGRVNISAQTREL